MNYNLNLEKVEALGERLTGMLNEGVLAIVWACLTGWRFCHRQPAARLRKHPD